MVLLETDNLMEALLKIESEEHKKNRQIKLNVSFSEAELLIGLNKYIVKNE